VRLSPAGGKPDRGNEAKRDDASYSHVSVWEYQGEGEPPVMHKEPLVFDNVTPSQRSYK